MQALAPLVGAEELLLLVGLVLVSFGLWSVWKPGAFLVPGAVLVWIALPSRSPFVARPSEETKRKR